MFGDWKRTTMNHASSLAIPLLGILVAATVSVASPDARVRIRIADGERLGFAVTFRGQPVVDFDVGCRAASRGSSQNAFVDVCRSDCPKSSSISMLTRGGVVRSKPRLGDMRLPRYC
jgi:hypothetical protein